MGPLPTVAARNLSDYILEIHAHSPSYSPSLERCLLLLLKEKQEEHDA